MHGGSREPGQSPRDSCSWEGRKRLNRGQPGANTPLPSPCPAAWAPCCRPQGRRLMLSHRKEKAGWMCPLLPRSMEEVTLRSIPLEMLQHPEFRSCMLPWDTRSDSVWPESQFEIFISEWYQQTNWERQQPIATAAASDSWEKKHCKGLTFCLKSKARKKLTTGMIISSSGWEGRRNIWSLKQAAFSSKRRTAAFDLFQQKH